MIIEGLSCANCAAKIELEVAGLKGVNSASIDFVSQKLIFEVHDETDIPELDQNVQDIIKKIEPEAKIIYKSEKDNTKINRINSADQKEYSNKSQILRIIIGGLIFLTGIVFSFSAIFEFLLFLLSYIIVGGEIVLRAIKEIMRGQLFSENFLMSVATIGAFFIGEYPEGVAVMLFYLVGELFQDMAVDHSRKSISELMDIRPDYANLKVGKEMKIISPEDLKIGDVIVVKPGEKVPIDGKVIEGTSMADTVALTGESVPRKLVPGSSALSGFINMNGVLTIEVEKIFEDSTVSKILELVQNASSRKASTEKFITRFARYYTPAVVFGALAIAVIPPILISGADFSEWVYRALVFLVISCPCALVISIPLGFFGGIGGASKRGILVKGSNYLEALNDVNVVVFDKTGTLTKGVFEVIEIKSQGKYSNEEILEYAAMTESHSNHPIAASILSAYKKEIDFGKIEEFNEIAGFGVKAKIGGEEVIAGNAKYMLSENVDYKEAKALGTIIYLAINKTYAGYIVISDKIKEDSARAIRELKKLGIEKIVMLTGDLKDIGKKIGAELGVDEVYSELLPADKVEKLEFIQNRNISKSKVIFVGDGINDAPVLARADVGMAMGALGSDAAIEASDIVIMTDEPSKIVTAIKVAKRTKSIVIQNIVFALGVKALVLVLGALGLASMWEAVFADTGVALIAIFNSLRAMNTKNI